jgi:CRISPR-associated protein Cas1
LNQLDQYLLQQYRRRGKDTAEFVGKIKESQDSLEGVNLIPELMGVEGNARSTYYSAFDVILRKEFEFEKRTKMPPQNMVNCLISFGNSLLYSTTLSEIYHTQLNPTISYLHEPGDRRFSLSLDISEVFKPVIVDRVIFNLINNRIIKPNHFQSDLNGCLLGEDGKKLFLEEYRNKLGTTIYNSRLSRNISYQRLIRIECFKIVKHLLGENKYVGFRSK